MRPRALPVTAVVAVGVAGLAALVPWHRSGTVERSGVAIVRSAERLGLIDDGVPAAVVATWRVLPVVAALAVLALSVDRPSLAAGLASVGGVVAVAVGAVVLDAPGARAAGPLVSVVAGTVAIVAGVGHLAVVAAARRRSGRGASPTASPDDGQPSG